MVMAHTATPDPLPPANAAVANTCHRRQDPLMKSRLGRLRAGSLAILALAGTAAGVDRPDAYVRRRLAPTHVVLLQSERLAAGERTQRSWTLRVTPRQCVLLAGSFRGRGAVEATVRERQTQRARYVFNGSDSVSSYLYCALGDELMVQIAVPPGPAEFSFGLGTQ